MQKLHLVLTLSFLLDGKRHHFCPIYGQKTQIPCVKKANCRLFCAEASSMTQPLLCFFCLHPAKQGFLRRIVLLGGQVKKQLFSGSNCGNNANSDTKGNDDWKIQKIRYREDHKTGKLIEIRVKGCKSFVFERCNQVGAKTQNQNACNHIPDPPRKLSPKNGKDPI